MDPQVAWTNLLIAWISHDWEQVLELSEALLEWLDKDGFPPEFSYPQELGEELNRVVSRSACEFSHLRAASVLSAPDGILPDVPFTLACRGCRNDGPDTVSQARQAGWLRIEYAPASAFESFLGTCPNCPDGESQLGRSTRFVPNPYLGVLEEPLFSRHFMTPHGWPVRGLRSESEWQSDG